MKKALLLSVVASVAVMAGGDIAPVPAPVVEEVSAWDFSGQAVVYYNSWDRGANDIFDQSGARGDFGLQLRAVNKDVFAGIGFGGEVSGLSTLNLENGIVSGVMQATGNAVKGNDIDDITDGGWISQLYMTYGFGNTSLKLGRQELPKALSPFAFSENWNVFKNTFDAALIVNTDISNTTIVGAWVYGGNQNGVSTNMTDYNAFNDHDGVYMLTLQNKSVDGLTLTGTWYYASDMIANNNVNILWGDAKYAFNDYVIAGQVGTVMSDAFTKANGFRSDDDTVAWGLKAGGNFGMFDASLAYTGVDNAGIGVFNVGGVKTPLYTQMILNQDAIRFNNDTFVARAGVKALGGKFGAAFGYSNLDAATSRGGLVDGKVHGSGDYSELDLTYKTKVFNDSTTLFAGYIYQDRSYDATNKSDWSDNVIRFWGRYNF